VSEDGGVDRFYNLAAAARTACVACSPHRDL